MMAGDLQQFAYAWGTLVIFSLQSTVFWPYFLGALLLAIGLPIIIRNELPQERGLEKILPFGPLFFAVPMMVFAGEHFTVTRGIAQNMPAWIPWHRFWVYLVGTALIAGAFSIVIKKKAQLAATLAGIMFCSFVLLLHIPNVVASPHNRIVWAVALRDLAFSGGAFAFAGAQINPRLTQKACQHSCIWGAFLSEFQCCFSAWSIFCIPTSFLAFLSAKSCQRGSRCASSGAI